MIATDVTVFTDLEYVNKLEVAEDDSSDVVVTATFGHLASRVGFDLLPEEAIRFGDAIAALGHSIIDRREDVAA